jgi:tetratricopeptide (TPR) repeat protein
VSLFSQTHSVILLILGSISWIGLIFGAVFTIQEIFEKNGKNNNQFSIIFSVLLFISFWLMLAGFSAVSFFSNTPKDFQIQVGPWRPPQLQNGAYVFDSYNFRFKEAPKEWKAFDPKNLIPYSQLGFYQENPAKGFIVVATNQSLLNKANPEEAIKSTIALVNADNQSRVIREKEQLHIQGMEGLRIGFESLSQDKKIYQYACWVSIYHGYLYLLMSWSEKDDGNSYLKVFDQMASHFELIDPKRVIDTVHKPAQPNYKSRFFPYTISVKGEWENWDDMNDYLMNAEYGLVIGREYSFFVIPTLFVKQPIGLRLFAQAAVSQFGIDLNSDKVQTMRIIKEDGWDGLLIEALSKNQYGKELIYKFKILVKKNIGLTIGVTTEFSKYSKSTSILERALGMVTTTEFEKLSVEDLLPEEKKKQSVEYHKIGIQLMSIGRIPDGFEYLITATKWNPKDQQIINNLVYYFATTKHFEEGYQFLSKNIDAWKEYDFLYAMLALFERKTGRMIDAEKHFSQAFSKGLEHNELFEEYVNLLIEEKKEKKAIHEAQNYADKLGTTSAQLILASFYESLGYFLDAKKILESLHQRLPFDNQVLEALLTFLIKYHETETALKIIDQEISSQGSMAFLYYYKGWALFEMEKYNEARLILESALEIDPTLEDAESLLQKITEVKKDLKEKK